VDEWLPERHLARFVVEVIAGLDLRAMTGSYRGSGSASYHPTVLLGIMVYGYATGVFSSRKLERATYDSVAFRFIAANDHPDHDTIAAFRRRFLGDIEKLFVEVLLLAREMGMLSIGTVGLDGTKIHANASRHSALSYEHAGRIEAQLKAEVAELMAKAEASDRADLPDDLSIPDELARREERGLTTKLHVRVVGNGLPVQLELSPGQANDAPMAELLLNDLPRGAVVLADRAYDADWIREVIEDQECKACTRPRSTALSPPLTRSGHTRSATSSNDASENSSSSGTSAHASTAASP